MKKYVFISYKSEEYDCADKVRSALIESGVPCWMAPESIKGGSSYAGEIPRAIRECSVFVLILTKSSQNSQWVKRELDRAINEKKLIMPLLPEKMTFNDDMTFYLTNIQQYFAYNDWDRELSRMIDDVCAAMGIERVIPAPPADEAPAQEPAPEKDKKAEKAARQKAEATRKKAGAASKKPAKRKKALIIIAAALALILCVIGASVLINSANSVSIGGHTFSLNSTTVSLSDAALTPSDIEALSKIEKLGRLELKNCSLEGVKDLSAVSCGSLRYLTISGCGMSHELLSTMRLEDAELYEADLSGNALVTLNALAGMKKVKFLKKLDVSDNQITGLSGIDNCIYLESIDASGNSITNANGLKNSTLLSRVDLSRNELTDISGLASSADRIVRLYLSGNKLTDISEASKMKALEYLDISDNKLRDISPISSKKSLVGLDASNNRLSGDLGLAPYAFLKTVNIYSDSTGDEPDDSTDKSYSLRYLDLSGNDLSSLNLISQLPLSALDLDGNKAGFVSVSLSGPIDYINLHKCDLSDNFFLFGMPESKYLILDYTDDLNLSKLASVEKIYIIDCPLDKQVATENALNGRVEFLTSAEYDARDDLGADKLSGYETRSIINKTKGIE